MAQALEYLNASQTPQDSDSDATTESEADIQDLLHPPSSPPSSSQPRHLDNPSHRLSDTTRRHPRYELTPRRKFEISELCSVFFHRYVSYLYMAILSIFGFLNNWSLATVAGSSWAINIPFHNFGYAESCSQNSFAHRVVPAGGCLYAYYFTLSMFALIVIPLSLFELREQAVVQVMLGFLRFVTLAVIIVYCMVRLFQHGDACRERLEDVGNVTTPINIGVKAIVVKFEVEGWLMAIPVITSAFVFQTGISSLTHPVEKKQYHHWLLVCVFVVALVCYMSLGVVVPLWFRAATQETATLSWVSSPVLQWNLC